MKDATWEPIESFIVDNGWLHETFIDYCVEKKLDDILPMARKKAVRSKQEKPQETNLPREVGRSS